MSYCQLIRSSTVISMLNMAFLPRSILNAKKLHLRLSQTISLPILNADLSC
jgi:hypothetical protein